MYNKENGKNAEKGRKAMAQKDQELKLSGQMMIDDILAALEAELSRPVGRGIFGADMKVSLLNDGPVTIIVDSKLKF